MNDTSLDLTTSYHYRASLLRTLANSSLLRLGLYRAVLASSLRSDFFVLGCEHMRFDCQSDGRVSRKILRSVDLRRRFSCASQDRVHHVRGTE